MVNGVYGENQKEIILLALKEAEKYIKIAVAWINFDEYYEAILAALQRGVVVKVVINKDEKYIRYEKHITELCLAGMEIKAFSPLNYTSYVHHKFCIIDRKFFLTGSFNWTKNANSNNFEDLLVSSDSLLLREYENIFKSLWDLSTQDFMYLRRPKCCNVCGFPIINLCVLSEENSYETRTDIYQVCGCGELHYVKSEFFTIHFYNNLMEMIDRYSDEIEYYQREGQKPPKSMEIYFQYNMSRYLMYVRKNRMGMPIIHAVGVWARRFYYGDVEEQYIKILWKERYASQYVQEEYLVDSI